MSARGYAAKHNLLPRANLRGAWLLKNGLVDSIGLSSIVFDSGTGGDFTNSSFHWSYNATMASIDTALGGGKLFIGTDPISLSWQQWMGQSWINLTYLFMGATGVAGYSIDQTLNIDKILRYLHSATPDAILSLTDVALLGFFQRFPNATATGTPSAITDADGRLAFPRSGLSIDGGYIGNTVSTGANLGPELCVPSSWGAPPSGVTLDTSAGTITFSGSQADYASFLAVSGILSSETIRVSYTISSTSGVSRVYSNSGDKWDYSPGDYVKEWVAGLGVLGFASGAGVSKFIGVISNISVKKVLTATGINKFGLNNISCWGDSLTDIGYPMVLQVSSGCPTYNGGVGGETSTQIKSRMIADSARYGDIAVIWAGRNNYDAPVTVMSDIADMVAALTTSNYIVLSVLNSSTEIAGSAGYLAVESLNSSLSSVYNTKFLDIRSILVDSYNPEVPQDVTDHGNDIVPSSLRYDTLHINKAGIEIVAEVIEDKLISLGYPASPSVLASVPSYPSRSIVGTGLTPSNIAFRGCLVEPGATNKTQCFKYNPTATTNITKSGDAASVLAVVDAPTGVLSSAVDRNGRAINLSSVCSLGKIYELDNTLGTTTANVTISGTTNNTNPHSGSVYVQLVSGAAGKAGWSITGGNEFGDISSAVLTEVLGENKTPGNTSHQLMLRAVAGSKIRFILPQLVESPYIINSVITYPDAAAASARVATVVSTSATGVFPAGTNNFAIYGRVIPTVTGQSKTLLSSYVDATAKLEVYTTATSVNINKRSSSTDVICSVSYTHSKNTLFEFVALVTEMGMAICTRQYSAGVWSAWSAWTADETSGGQAAAQVGSTLEIGSLGGANNFAGYFPKMGIVPLRGQTTLDGYQSVIRSLAESHS